MKISWLRNKENQRGASLTEYGMLVAVFVAVSVGAITSLESNSEEFLENSSESIGEPRESRERANESVLDLPADWERPTTPTTLPPPTDPPTTPAPTTIAPTTITVDPTVDPSVSISVPPTANPIVAPTIAPVVIVQKKVTTASGFCLSMQSGILKQRDCASAPELTAVELTPGVYQIEFGGGCMGSVNGGTGNGTKLTAATCGDTGTEWAITGSGPYQFINIAASAAQGTPICADVKSGSSDVDADMILWTCHGRANQDFSV